MSWWFKTECHGCLLKGECKDQENINAGINKCYEDHVFHKGGGEILLKCGNLRPLPTITQIVACVPPTGEHVGSPLPAVITKVHGPQLVDLDVISGETVDGYKRIYPMFNVPYSAKSEMGHWHYPD